MSQPSVLLVEDDESWMSIYRYQLKSEEYDLVEATSVQEAMAKIANRDFAVVLTDLKLLGATNEFGGFEILEATRHVSPATQVIIITAFGSQEHAIRAMQQGALDYVTKPVDFDKLRYAIATAIHVNKQFVDHREVLARPETSFEPAQLQHRTDQLTIIGNSSKMQAVHKKVTEAAKSNNPVLIVGQPGVGKFLIGRSIHFNSKRTLEAFGVFDSHELSRLGNRAFVRLLHYTNGSLLFRNIHDLTRETIDIASEILRRCATLNIRILASSLLGRDELTDLIYELDPDNILLGILDGRAISIWLPPLSMRRDGDDVASLAGQFLREFVSDTGRSVTISNTALNAIGDMSFELENVTELRDLVRLAAQESAGEIEEDHIIAHTNTTSLHSRHKMGGKVFVSYSDKDRDFVRRFMSGLLSDQLDFWVDYERIPIGAEFWDKVVEDGLRSSKAMLLIVSPNAMESKEVAREWNYYLRQGLPIVVLVFKVANIHFRLEPIQRIVYDAEREKDIQQAVIRSLVDILV